MDVALPSRETSHDFFRRARARLSLDVPAGTRRSRSAGHAWRS
jgi:hypothetical protein